MKKFYLSLGFTILALQFSYSQVTLAGTSYIELFDNLGSGLPTGWTVRTGANASSLGTTATLTTTATAWANTTGAFKNFASADGLVATSTATEQANNTDRALGLRQTAAVGDPGGAFTLQILNTNGLSNFQLSFKLQSLDQTSPRTTTWLVQYASGSSPSSFTTVATVPPTLQTGNSTFSNTTVTVNFGSQLDNLPQNVWIRIVALSASTGSGNRPSTGIDDFTLTYSNTGGGDLTPPTISSLLPADNATGIRANSTARMVFNEPIQKGASGTITVRTSDNSVVQSIDITSPSVTVSDNTASFSFALGTNTDYHINVTSGAFEDVSGNDFAGIADNTTWNFRTGNIVSNLFATNFNSCTSSLSDRFTQFSLTGSIVWACTTFGRDPNNLPGGSAPNGVQINGFASGTNVSNVDWIISPPIDLSTSTYPLLSFWSRTRFNGAPLQLKVSTDYVSGDPTSPSVHWTDLNGRFPAETSDAWTLSSNINLSDFKLTNVRIAFVYSSTDEDGARWTLDDISVDNSATPPPPSLTASTTDIQFGFVANGSTADKTFILTGNDLTNDITLTSTGNFQLSKDGTSFTSSINYTVAEANNIPKTVFVRFAPNQNSQNFTGTINIGSGGLSSAINVKGTSIDPAITLEVVNWNIEWFGSTSNGPTNDAQQEQNVRTILQNIGADLYGLTEVVDETRLANVVSTMPGYAYVISNFGSHTNPNETPPPAPDALAQAQKLAFVYKTSVFSNVTTTALLSAGINTPADVSTTSYNNWSSGRYPFMMSADVTLDGVTKNIKFILIHAKANTSPTATSYNRRKAGSDELHALLNTTYATDNVVLLGDYNDDLDQTITDGINPPTTSYVAFTSDASNYSFVTLPLSQAGKRSTVSHDNVIDHVIISSELGSNFMNASANILTDVSGLVSNYASTTSDHYPVFTRYAFSATLPVKLNYFTAEKVKQSVKLGWASSLENNSKAYVVERSSDGLQFVSIGTVPSNGRASVYEFTDEAPVAGNNYYRLRMVDIDEKFEYSKAIRITFDKEILITIRPNPTPGLTKISLEGVAKAPLSVSVYDLQGRMIREISRQAGPNQPVDLDLSGINKGVYILKIRLGNVVKTEKLVLQ